MYDVSAVTLTQLWLLKAPCQKMGYCAVEATWMANKAVWTLVKGGRPLTDVCVAKADPVTLRKLERLGWTRVEGEKA